MKKLKKCLIKVICFVYRWLKTLIDSSNACPLCKREFHIPNAEETEPSNEAIIAEIAEVGFNIISLTLGVFNKH